MRGVPYNTKQYIDARVGAEKGIRAVLDWLRGRRDAGRLAGGRAPVYLPDYKPGGFVGRADYLETLHAALTDEPGVFLLTGEPGSGKSTLALMFAYQAQRDFDAVLFQTCGRRPVEEIAGELAERLREQLGEEVAQRPPEEKLAKVKKWLTARRSLLVLDDLWLENRSGRADGRTGTSPLSFRDLVPGPPLSILFTSRRPSLPGVIEKQVATVESFTPQEAEEVSRNYLKPETVAQHREALLDFAERVERLPIAVAVGADLLRRQFGPLTEAARGLALDRLRSEVQDVPGLLERAIEAQGPLEQRLLEASAVCAAEGFWLPLAIKIAGLSEAEGAAARDVLVNSSLLRVLDRERQRFQLHALLREQLRRGMGVRGMGVRGTGILPVRVQEDAGGTGARRGRGILPVEEHAQDARATSITALQERHAAVVEGLFKDWETRWQECRECLAEVIPAAEFLWGKRETSREAWLSYRGYVLASRVGELDAARRIVTREEGFCAGRDDREAKDALQRSYGNQAVILKAWGRLEEALALHKKQEAICLELGNKSGLGHCYWYWGLLARAQGDRETEKQKLEAALALFSELKMPRERDAVRAQSNRLTGPPAPKAGSA